MSRRENAGVFLIVNPRIQRKPPSPGSGAAGGGTCIPKSISSSRKHCISSSVAHFFCTVGAFPNYHFPVLWAWSFLWRNFCCPTTLMKSGMLESMTVFPSQLRVFDNFKTNNKEDERPEYLFMSVKKYVWHLLLCLQKAANNSPKFFNWSKSQKCKPCNSSETLSSLWPGWCREMLLHLAAET